MCASSKNGEMVFYTVFKAEVKFLTHKLLPRLAPSQGSMTFAKQISPLLNSYKLFYHMLMIELAHKN